MVQQHRAAAGFHPFNICARARVCAAQPPPEGRVAEGILIGDAYEKSKKSRYSRSRIGHAHAADLAGGAEGDVADR